MTLISYIHYPRETEFRLTCSIFAPVQDALDRCNLSPEDVSYCLLVGGSSLIPQVSEALKDFFSEGELLIYKDKDDVQTTVARGAAYHAFALTAFGRSLIQPVANENLCILTANGPVELVPKETPLPYPKGGSYATSQVLAVPKTINIFDNLDLRVEIVASSDQRSLGKVIWKIEGPLQEGDPLLLEYRYDDNQAFDLKLTVANRENGKPFEWQIENPFTNVVNPQPIRTKIEESEELLRTGEVPRDQIPEKLTELAYNYSEIGQNEKALDLLKKVLKAKQRPDAYILNKMGIIAGDLGDYAKQEKYYREADRLTSWSGPLFNLALSLKRQNKISEAVKVIEEAIKKNPEAPHYVFRAMLANIQKDSMTKEKYLELAFKSFDDLLNLSEWELDWYTTAADLANDKDMLAKAKAENKRRRTNRSSSSVDDEALLPIIKPSLRRVE